MLHLLLEQSGAAIGAAQVKFSKTSLVLHRLLGQSGLSETLSPAASAGSGAGGLPLRRVGLAGCSRARGRGFCDSEFMMQSEFMMHSFWKALVVHPGRQGC